jgi:hypothetical protein
MLYFVTIADADTSEYYRCAYQNTQTVHEAAIATTALLGDVPVGTKVRTAVHPVVPSAMPITAIGRLLTLEEASAILKLRVGSLGGPVLE